MTDETRISNLKAFLLKQDFLKPFKYQVLIIDDVPFILFDSINDNAKGKLSNILDKGDLLHIQVAVKAKEEKKK
jgi:hypothetical protein